MLKPRTTLLISMILAAAASRLIPHPPNMTSLTAVALFGGAYFADRRLAFLVPLATLFLSDLIVGFYSFVQMVIDYFSFVLIVCIGFRLQKRRTVVRIAGAALVTSVLFFFVTNFGVWAFGSLYQKTIAGLIACYVTAIPFFKNALYGDALYTALLFGGFAVLESQFFLLRDPATPNGIMKT
jgi:hypothetical protein